MSRFRRWSIWGRNTGGYPRGLIWRRGARGRLARHALRRMDDLIKAWGLEVRGLDGQPYDAGMAARVIDTIEDGRMPEGAEVIAETVSPMVLWRGQVLRVAEVVTRQRGKRQE